MTPRALPLIACWLLLATAGSVWADNPATSPDALALRGAEIKAKREALESRYRQSLRECYQQFNVTACRNENRERYIQDSRALREQELVQSQQEREQRTAVARQRLQDKQAQSADREREASLASEQASQRAQEQQRKVQDHAANGNARNDYLDKQRDAAAHRAEVERRAQDREREKPRAAPLPRPTGTP